MASWILAQGLSAQRPLVILSDNSIDHALFALAAMHAGVPAAAISPAYSLVSKDFDKLQEHDRAARSRRDLCVRARSRSRRRWRRSSRCTRAVDREPATPTAATRFHSASIAATPESDAVAKAFAAVGPDTIAKFLFTSGSTGTPKAVINTQRMLTSSQQAKAQTWSFLEDAETTW